MTDVPDIDAEADGLPDETGPERTCIVTREKRGKDGLIRFVIAPDRSVVPDIRAKLPGRGAWVLANAATVALAVKRKSFARAFKKPVEVAPDLPAFVDSLLEADVLQFLSIANKAGLVTCGTVKVEAAIGAKSLAGLIHAAEAGDDGLRKLEGAMRRRFGDQAASIPRVHLFVSSQLDLALGRTHVIHAALSAGAAGEAFLARSERLGRYRALEARSTGDRVRHDDQRQADPARPGDSGSGPET